eukprot:CAMPEP_0204868422 /NCGR_PEP_ID=MMETSP1348-20121228/26513_1 /ASSEMBLY_ACC=CAM_ASM_000700 /TAXON_ID=215587 /ORGANISM="Aplanochytrium stocchinoi, Strain GSBS06" /LENGTH=281 /DNA_ID=CAMNT_0052021341 /DNA_START=20 /DNA_END=865 /DNA_ORIENTATION=-
MGDLGVKIETVEAEIFNDGVGVAFDPIQPKESEKQLELQKLISDAMYPEFIDKYGGQNFLYQRFLLARQMNVKKAEKMVRKCIDIRKEWNLDGEISKSAEEEERLALIRDKVKPVWVFRIWGFTKHGNVVTYGNIEKLDLKELLKRPEVDIKRYYLEFLDKIFVMQNYSNSAPRRNSNDEKWKANVEIINLQGISMAHLHISGLRLLNRILKLAQDVAPEILGKSYIINAPWFFSGAWAIIKRVLAQEIIDKVTVSSGNCKEEIVEHLGSEELYEDLIKSV